MKRILLVVLLSLVVPAIASAATAPATVTTTKKSAIAIGSGSFALVKGTKLEVVARDGEMLVVKFRSSQGKIPLADTDFAPDATAPTPTTPPPTAAATAPKPTTATKPAAPASTPPALTTDPSGRQPTTTYGKAVQKAKQVTETQKSTRVDPTKDIMDDEPKKP